MKTVLIIDDDLEAQQLIKTYLEREGFGVYCTPLSYESSGDSRTVTVHIRKIREKIEKKPKEPQIIVNVWGIGYKFTVSGIL